LTRCSSRQPESDSATDSGAESLPGGESHRRVITIDDFAKIDLRIAKIVNCEAVDGSTNCCGAGRG
jgi:methionyl-tRNA synthetase